jgi:DNA-binding response OmpR family regulator
LVLAQGVIHADARLADECLRRPFAMVDLIVRVRALAKRRKSRPPLREVRLGDYRLSHEGDVRHRGVEIVLTGTEKRVLGFLVSRVGEVVAKRELLKEVWGSDTGDPNVVEVNISTLRRKLERRGLRIIHTVRGQGYRLDEPVRFTGARGRSGGAMSS